MQSPFPLELPVNIDMVLLGFTEPAPPNLRDILEDVGCAVTYRKDGQINLLVEPMPLSTGDCSDGLRIQLQAVLFDQDIASYGWRLAEALRAVLSPSKPFTLRISATITRASRAPTVQFRV